MRFFVEMEFKKMIIYLFVVFIVVFFLLVVYFLFFGIDFKGGVVVIGEGISVNFD